MPVSKEHIFEPGIYFVTFTNYKWIPLFKATDTYGLVYSWFDVLKTNGHSILGYVIMPNHVHALIGLNETKQSINTIVGNGKRFIAYGIIKKLEEQNNVTLLKTLADGVTPSVKRRGKLHEVFEPSFDIKLCRTYKFVTQKLNYIHSNPVSKKWMLANDATEYAHSSAAFYEKGIQGVYEVRHSNEWVYEKWDS